MTLYSNAFTTYSAIGRREDLSDFIYDISPMDCPFMDGIAKTSADQVNHEWQTDSLDANVNTNQQLEGDVIAASAATATVRAGNICEIAYKALAVTGTQEAVIKAGRRSELKYQILKNSKALKRDMESSLLSNKAKNAGNATTARELAGVEAWLATNTSRGTGAGADPTGDGTDTATDGDQRTFTESLVKSVLKDCFDNGGDPDCIFVSSKHKQAFSGFTGNATREIGAEDKTLVATIELYRSDFGDMQVFPHRFMEGSTGGAPGSIRSALVLQKDMWALATLRAPHIIDLARTGDAEPRAIIAEYTLEARNEASSGIVADLS